jgi:transcriptional regulator with XRE-family HTH domain
VAPSPTQAAQAPPAGLAELVQLVDRLQRENRDLAGLVGSLQQRLIFAEDRIAALEAPTTVQNADPAAQDDPDTPTGQDATQEPSALANIEALKTDPRPATIRRLAQVLGVSPEDLMPPES